MEQHIVISSNNGRLGNPEIQGTKLITFSLENDRIMGVRDEVPDNRDIWSLLDWFSLNNITKLLASCVSPFLHQSLENLGVVVVQSSEVANDPFFHRFIFEKP
jgi:hypothetical protein